MKGDFAKHIKPSLKDIMQAGDIPKPMLIGKSRKKRALYGFRFGRGTFKISLIAGCHADEPTGPIFLSHLVKYLHSLPRHSPFLSELSWWIVPHVNPDGAFNNRKWYSSSDNSFDLVGNLLYAQRELPGDDVEFGFPLLPDIPSLRGETEAVYQFWKTAGSSFDLHVSLHGMRIAYGPWFLIDRDFMSEAAHIIADCSRQVAQMNYVLHDVDRKGEKGFYRLAEGFGSRPDSRAMREHFLLKNDHEMASRFHASSMESIRSLGDSCLTLVTEMPLFIIPRENHHLIWPDPCLSGWEDRLKKWQYQLSQKLLTADQVRQQATDEGLTAMPVMDQMRLQWHFIWSGINSQIKDHGQQD